MQKSFCPVQTLVMIVVVTTLASNQLSAQPLRPIQSAKRIVNAVVPKSLVNPSKTVLPSQSTLQQNNAGSSIDTLPVAPATTATPVTTETPTSISTGEPRLAPPKPIRSTVIEAEDENIDTDDLRILSEWITEPAPELALPLQPETDEDSFLALPALTLPIVHQQPGPVIAEPIPQVRQQAPRVETRSPQVAEAEPPKPEEPASHAAQAEAGSDMPVDISAALELYRRSDFDAAKKMLEEICQNDTKLPPPGIFLVQFAATTGQDDRIRFWLDQATWEHPDDPEAYALLAEFAMNDNRFAEAKLLAEKGISLLGNLATNEDRRQSIETFAHSVLGRLYQIRGDWDKARLYFEKLTAVDPDNVDILTRLGFVTANQEHYEEAIVWYQKAVAKGAKLTMPKLIVSQIADQQGKTDVADKYFNEVMKTPNIDAESLRVAVQIQLRRGNLDEADRLLQQAIKAEPNNYDNLILTGAIDLYKKDYPAAEKRFQDAILINPDSYAASQGLAQALVEQDDTLKKDRAVAYAKNNVQRSGESPDSVATLAWVFFKSDKMIDAEFLVNVVLATGEMTPLSAYYFAEIMAEVGQTDKALLLVKIATGSNTNFMKKAEAEALQKRLESELDKPTTTSQQATSQSATPLQPVIPGAGTSPPVSAPVRFPGTRN